MIVPIFIALAFSLAAVWLGWSYFGRYQVQRPPLGVFTLWDVSLMMGGIVVVPYLYLLLPPWLVGGLLGLAALGVLSFTLESVIAPPLLRWLLILGLGGSVLLALHTAGAHSHAFFAANNILQILVVVGIANLWVQSGLQARHAALLGIALTIYDVLFTVSLPLMVDLFVRLEGLPFAPLLGWSGAEGQWLAIGVGDLLLATVFPPLMRKAYGRQAGRTALLLVMGALGAVFALPLLGLLPRAFPVMVVLGPLMAFQVAFWRRRGPERTMWQYRRAEQDLAIQS